MLSNEVYVAIFSYVRDLPTFAAVARASKEARANLAEGVTAVDTGEGLRDAALLRPFAHRAGSVRLSGTFYTTAVEELELIASFRMGRVAVYFDNPLLWTVARPVADILPSAGRVAAAVAAMLAQGARDPAVEVAVHDARYGASAPFLARRGHLQLGNGALAARLPGRRLALTSEVSALQRPDPDEREGGGEGGRGGQESGGLSLLVCGPWSTEQLLKHVGGCRVERVEYTVFHPCEYHYFCAAMAAPFSPASLAENLGDAPRWKEIGASVTLAFDIRDTLRRVLEAAYAANPGLVFHLFAPDPHVAAIARRRWRSALRGTEVWHASAPAAPARAAIE